MNEIDEKSLEIMRKFHKDKLLSISFENKDFEKEVINLFTELFQKEEEIELNYISKNQNKSRGLDGGTASDIRKLYREYYEQLDKLKVKYNIS